MPTDSSGTLNIFNWVLDAIYNLALWVVDFLPPSPFTTIMEGLEEMPSLPWLNWFVPIDDMVIVGEFWLACIAVYLVYSLPLRTARLIP